MHIAVGRCRVCIFACVMNNRPISGGATAKKKKSCNWVRVILSRRRAQHSVVREEWGTRESQQAEGIGHAAARRTRSVIRRRRRRQRRY